ncbi:uncharacterized protein LOC135484513 [Lineus longissimus]|uniref:uncharacterized protein LOC135484513 n=1 Tax=Lineus longissimus TaxID=88925 RepID=UPI00315D2882
MASTVPNDEDVHSIKTDYSAHLSTKINKDDDQIMLDVISSGTTDLGSFVMDESDLGLEDDDKGCCPLKCCAKKSAYHFGGGEGHSNVHINEAFSGESVYVETVMDFNNNYYRKWYDVVSNDDPERFDKMLHKAGEVKKKLLINGRFKFNIPHSVIEKATRAHQQYERPLCVAAAFASSYVFTKLLKEDVCVTARDKHGCNVVHALVIAAADCKEREEQYFAMYNSLLENTDRDTQRALLLGETLQGQRPLELAAKLGAFGIFRVILETPSFFGKILCQTGACSFYRYNLSDYEDSSNPKRYYRSPLRYICNIQEEHVDDYIEHKIHEIPVIKSWMRRKYLSNFGLILLWLTIKFANVVMCTIIDPNALPLYVACRENITSYSDCTNSADSNWLVISTVFAIITGFYSVVVVLFDLFELVVCRRCKQEKGLADHAIGNNQFGTLSFYRCCHFLLALSTIIMLVVAYLYRGKDNLQACLTSKAVMLPFIVIDLFHVLENVPLFGTFVTTMQRLLKITLKYVLFSFLIQLIFALYFYTTVTGFVPSASGTGIEVTGFENILAAIYTTILLISNTVPSTNADAIAVRFPLYIYIIIMILLFLNYLVAILMDIQRLKPERMSLLRDMRRLRLAITVEERFAGCARKSTCAEKNSGYFIVATYIKDRNFRNDVSANTPIHSRIPQGR